MATRFFQPCTVLVVSLLATRGVMAQEPGPADDGKETVKAAPGVPPPHDFKDFAELDLKAMLETKVVTATKTEQRPEEAPAIITVVRREEMLSWGYNTVAEVLRHVAGFYIVDDFISPNAGVRGVFGGLRSESGIIKVMIDGHPVSMRLTGSNWLGPELVPVTAIKRIEIIRGPASALYGADAFLGVVNIITRDGVEIDGAHSIFNGNLAGRNLGGGHDLSFGFRRGKFDVLLSGRLLYQDFSGVDLPTTSPAPTIPAFHANDPEADGLQQLSGVGLLKLAYHFGERSRLTFTGYLSALDRGAEFADWTQLAHGVDSWGRFGENRVSLINGFTGLDLLLALSNSFELSFYGMYFAGAPTGRDRIELGSDTYYVKREFRYQGGEFGVASRWLVLPKLTIAGGMDVNHEHEELPSNLHVLKTSVGTLNAGDIREATSTRQGGKNFINAGGYLQAVWMPFKKSSLTGGIRYDYHNIYGHQVSGRAAVVVGPFRGLNAKLLYGSAFKAPSPLLLYGIPVRSGDIIGNPDLEPQHVHTVETQLAYSPRDFLTVKTDVAYSFVLNKAEFSLQGVNKVARNVAEVGSLSWETEAEARYRDWVRGYVNLSLQYTLRNIGEEGYYADLIGHENTVYPPLIVNAGVLGRVPRLPLRLTFEASYVSSRRASDSNILENGASYELSPYVLLGGSVAAYDLKPFKNKKTTLMVTLRNLLDARGPEPGFGGIDYPLPPRTVMLEWIQEL
jgi:outer membrane receptor protein involved in Fe transport